MSDSLRGSGASPQVLTAGSVVGVSTVQSWLIGQFEYGFRGSAHGYLAVCSTATDNAVACLEWLSLLS